VETARQLLDDRTHLLHALRDARRRNNDLLRELAADRFKGHSDAAIGFAEGWVEVANKWIEQDLARFEARVVKAEVGAEAVGATS
jgi:hypothetical protein